MAFVGVPDREMPFFRNHARASFPQSFWLEDDPLRRTRHLFALAEAYVRGLSGKREEEMSRMVAWAKDQWQKSVRKLEAQQARRLPKLPNPAKLGARPSESGDDNAAPLPKARRDLRVEDRARDTDGEERWDPAWGDPNTELPIPLPQGMRRLPAHDTEVPERDGPLRQVPRRKGKAKG